jgi:hypothetical protein
MAAIGATVPRRIVHIQIEKNGRLELGLYDNFSPKGMFFGSAVTPALIESLQNEGVLSPWTD